jgi:hypothetical protein
MKQLTKRQITIRLNRAVKRTNKAVAPFARNLGLRVFTADRDKNGFCFYFDDNADEGYRTGMNPLENIVSQTWTDILKEECTHEGIDFDRLHLNHQHRLPGQRGTDQCWGLGVFTL